MPDRPFDFWNLDFITVLPASGLFNAVIVRIDKLPKFVRLVPCFVEYGKLTIFSIARLFFAHVVHFYGALQSVLYNHNLRFTSAFW